MKFSVLILLIATVSAINLNKEGGEEKAVESGTPALSYAAKADSLKEVLETVATQRSFEANHTAAHTVAMDKAAEEC